MDNSEKLDKTSSPEIEDFYSYLIMEEISNAYYFHTKRLGKDFEKKKRNRRVGEFLDFYIQSNKLLLLPDVFENF